MTHIAVVGAGIIGAATADRLAAAGARVTLLEARQPGSGASGTSLAWLNSFHKPPRHYHDLSVRAIAEWRRLADGFGDPPWYVPTGSIMWADTGDLARHVGRLRDWDYPVTELTAAKVADLEPQLRLPPELPAVYFPADGFLHGGAAVRARVERAQSRAVVNADSPVADVQTDGAAVTGVRLISGRRVTADAYVFCAGAATPGLLAGTGIAVALEPGDAPDSPAPCLVAHVRTPARLVRRVIQAPDLSLRPLSEPGLYLEAGDLNAGVDVHTGATDLDRCATELLARATAVLPALASAGSPAGRRICVRPLPVDGKPIIGWLALDNAYLIVTHSGMTLGALLGRLAAAELLGEPQAVLQPYRPQRFLNPA